MTAAELIRQFEGCRLDAYPDPGTGGAPWTCGWGCTGPGIGPDTRWTQAEADAALDHRLAALTDVVLHLVKVPISPNELAALLSLAWNIGSSALAKSTVLKRLNQGDHQGAGDAFRLWVKAGGHVLQGLVNRREVERKVFLGLP